MTGGEEKEEKKKTVSKNVAQLFFPLHIEAKDFLSKMDFPSGVFELKICGMKFRIERREEEEKFKIQIFATFLHFLRISFVFSGSV
jgi:hypothetical protein